MNSANFLNSYRISEVQWWEQEKGQLQYLKLGYWVKCLECLQICKMNHLELMLIYIMTKIRYHYKNGQEFLVKEKILLRNMRLFIKLELIILQKQLVSH